MSILVTGGTGFLGSRLVEKLATAGNQVTVFSRKEDPALKAKGVKFVLGDVMRQDEIAKAFVDNIEVVYHLAANLDESDPRMYKENVAGAKNIAELSRAFGVAQIILMGSCGALGDTRVAREDGAHNPKTNYEKSKAHSENIIVNSGVPYTIIRAPVIIGPNEIWKKIFAAAKKKYPIIGSGQNHFHLAYIEDVSDLLVLVKNNGAAINNIFHVATKDAPTYRQVYKLIADEIGVEMPTKHVPVWLMKIASAVHVFSRKVRGKKPSLTMMGSSIDRLIRDRVISLEKTNALLGFSPRYDTASAIKETAASFRSQGLL